MIKIKTVLEQLAEEKTKNRLLTEKLERAFAEIDYILMMCNFEKEEDV